MALGSKKAFKRGIRAAVKQLPIPDDVGQARGTDVKELP